MVKKQITTTEFFDENGKIKKRVVEETYYDGDILQVTQPINPYVNGPYGPYEPYGGTVTANPHGSGAIWTTSNKTVPIAKLNT